MQSQLMPNITTFREMVVLFTGNECEYLNIDDAQKLMEKLYNAINAAIDYEDEDEDYEG